MIDAGFTAKRLEGLLEDVGESAADIEAVFISHEHADHASGVRGLVRKFDLPIFANEATASAIQKKITSKPKWNIFETGKTFTYKNLRISPFSIPHDAYDPVGFSIEWGGEDLFSPRTNLVVLTDLGYVPDSAKSKIQSADILIFESNYDDRLLEADDKRPWVTKQRIRSRHGHLSNESAAKVLESIENPRWKHLILSHLSKDCNSIDHVTKAFSGLFKRMSNLTFDIIDPVAGQAEFRPL